MALASPRRRRSSGLRASVIVFPGSNCERDAAIALERLWQRPVQRVWHAARELPPSALIVLPGGFSFGDYLRPAALAAASPILREVIAAARRGTPVLGICNGFQILCETGLLPGALLRNRSLRFVCRAVRLRVENARPPFTQLYRRGEQIVLPVAHKDGNYFADAATLARLEDKGQIVMRYAPDDNPNGALHHIAALSNSDGRVMGLMPHPERHADAALGGEDGARLFLGLRDAFA